MREIAILQVETFNKLLPGETIEQRLAFLLEQVAREMDES